MLLLSFIARAVAFGIAINTGLQIQVAAAAVLSSSARCLASYMADPY